MDPDSKNHNLPTVMLVNRGHKKVFCDMLPGHGTEQFLLCFHSVAYAERIKEVLLATESGMEGPGWEAYRMSPREWGLNLCNVAQASPVQVERVAFIVPTTLYERKVIVSEIHRIIDILNHATPATLAQWLIDFKERSPFWPDE